MAQVEAELKRRNAVAALVDWVLVPDAENTATDLSDPVIDAGVRDRLDTVIAALQGQLTVNTVDVSALATQATLSQILTALQGELNVDTDVSALATEVTLGQVLAALQGELNVDVDVSALSTEATLASVLAELQGTDALTDAELRNAPVPVSGPLTNTQLRDAPVGVADLDVKRAITDYETRLDYDVRTDGNPVYVGKAAQGTGVAVASWTIQLLEYDASNRLTRVQVLTGAWDNRAALGWG